MRAFILALVLAVTSLGAVAVTPSAVQAAEWRGYGNDTYAVAWRGGPFRHWGSHWRGYYGPGYGYSYYPGYYYPGYNYYPGYYYPRYYYSPPVVPYYGTSYYSPGVYY
jgi:hypothetical protein